MSQLIRLAFTDPHYLSYRYRPDCRHHGTISGKGTNASLCENCTLSPDVDANPEVDDVTDAQSSSDISSSEKSSATPETPMTVTFCLTLACVVFHSNRFSWQGRTVSPLSRRLSWPPRFVLSRYLPRKLRLSRELAEKNTLLSRREKLTSAYQSLTRSFSP